MRILQIGVLIVVVAGAGVAVLGYEKLSNPALPAPESVQKIVQLDQGWSDEERARYHFTSQGTLVLPKAWLMAMENGFFSSAKLLDPATLAGLRELTDGISPGQPWNKTGLPIGWTVDSWASPDKPQGPKLEKIGFNCAACHTGQLNYKGTAIRIEGGGAMHDAGTFQEMVGKAVLATYALPWKESAFLDTVTAQTGESRDAVKAELAYAAGVAFTGARQSLFTPLYEPEGYGRLDALQRIANTVFADDLLEPSNNRRGDGPVKFPYLWDIWRFDWVQYNASVRQPMVRNVGEALGVRAETNLVDKATGQAVASPHQWDSSVNVENLKWMEDTLRHLKAPAWPEPVLGAIKTDLAAQGQALFTTHCAGCHGIHVKLDATPPEWIVKQLPVTDIGTAPEAAVNFVEHTYSGAKLGQTQPLHAADALGLVTENVKKEAYENAKIPPEQRPDYDGFGRANIVVGDKAVYKARPLIGIWASPPYLHNGSVPTLFDLLSPERPAKFAVGTREYDPVKIGFVTTEFPGSQTFDTSQPGNSNAGHWFVDAQIPGRLGPAFPVADRMAIIEYLKSATYKTYPCTDIATKAPLDGAVCNR
jgi:mono/diheme cytochrome c family protein